MFGLGIPELIFALIVLACGVIALKVSSGKIKIGHPASRKCLACGFEGDMNTWLRNYNLPQFISLILLILYIIPGLIFIGWGWGKYKCPQCGALAKNVPLETSTNMSQASNGMKKCPFCAEDIKIDAIKCRYCSSSLSEA